ncbi:MULTISPECIES: LCP family protein [unclassified Streptomyces]|uniref:LCP family protein n=1 Tax=unclassified Streptomyces TaxID=2593676 RepID=UPI0006AF85C3|nr:MULTISPECIES: LCP family protein [unclassified Streptomyces]KOX33661.1 transcriptional regulator [Streptomyces sp. NRRL F-6491]KOX37130.1 transcriptional regulator [Streptomyces sp. NRRL F-6492]
MTEKTNSGRTDGGRRRRAPILVTGILAVLVLGGAGLAYAYYQKLDANIESVDINAQLGPQRPVDVDDGSLDILVLGSDSRSGDNDAYGKDEGGARSDTAMVVHVHEGHKRASVVSIPRDTLIERPDCTDAHGTDVPGRRRAMFNTAYEVGGPACAVKTVEAMSGIRMDHYVEVDFTGFKKLIDELGGVEITTTERIRDDKSHLDLAPGPHTLDGEQSLGLVRTRKSVGDGSDLGRIQLQQAFMKAFVEQVKDVGVLTNPSRLLGLADAATKAITPDSELDSVQELAGFAKGLSGIGAQNVHMVTLPVAYDRIDPNRVVPLEQQSGQVWKALRADLPVPAAATKGTATGAAEGVVR